MDVSFPAIVPSRLILRQGRLTLPPGATGLLTWPALLTPALDLPAELRQGLAAPVAAERALAFTCLEEVERAVRRAVGRIDLDALVRRAVENALDRARGRV